MSGAFALYRLSRYLCGPSGASQIADTVEKNIFVLPQATERCINIEMVYRTLSRRLLLKEALKRFNARY